MLDLNTRKVMFYEDRAEFRGAARVFFAHPAESKKFLYTVVNAALRARGSADVYFSIRDGHLNSPDIIEFRREMSGTMEKVYSLIWNG